MCDKKIIQVIFDDAQILDIAGPLEVFSEANRFVSENHSESNDDLKRKGYQISTVSKKEGAVKTSSGLQLISDFSFNSCLKHYSANDVDTLLISGGMGVEEACKDENLIAFVKTISKRARRVVSICSGVFILAAAGLLSGKRVTTHWEVNIELAEKYPEIQLDSNKIYINDGKFYSSAGVTAGIDLALHLVENDFGRPIALSIAKNLVIFMRRQGGQSQFSSRLAEQYAEKGRLTDLIDWIKLNHAKDLTIKDFAEKACTSERNLSRIFKKEIGITPIGFLEKIRVESATNFLENHDLGLKEIASNCGFGSEEKMRRAFKRQLDVLPKEYRNRFGF